MSTGCVEVPLPFAGSGDYKKEDADVIIWGIPSDCGAGSHRLGAGEGPRVIREASHIWNTVRTSDGYPFPDHGKVIDLGDINLANTIREETHGRIASEMPPYNPSQLTIMLGGDHSVTIPVVQNLPKGWGMIYLDAHPDCIEAYKGNRLSHACTLKRLIESEHVLPAHSVLIGVRAPEAEEVQFIKESGLTVFTAWDVEEKGMKAVCDKALQIIGNCPTYLSLDMDVLDASGVPGVENPEPGGLTSREVLYACHRFAGRIQAMDILEVTDQCDPAKITATAAARIVLDVVGRHIQRKRSPSR